MSLFWDIIIASSVCVLVPVGDLVFSWIMEYDDTDYDWDDDE
jgi:hypothetical protein